MKFPEWQERLKGLQNQCEIAARQMDAALREEQLATRRRMNQEHAVKQVKKELMAHCFTIPEE